ncbi:50S ribosomal protein L29 [Xanthocytophaga agilis]|uniref:Large ribosomal subunit protein uL29 n=1 Tax=Xanthocytophaga agilis TaxID=3048010 RepID=A0AAE3UE24_9BACT|nr:50S ribosomal protein L29 [Xanthocytophaga agilis]MDJ1500926.1 50S ribosomal protein L29 [Xanthocytophaga agilis]
MKNQDIKSLSIEELQSRISSEAATLQKLKFAHAITPIENPARIRASRRLIAQLNTELRARQIANSK